MKLECMECADKTFEKAYTTGFEEGKVYGVLAAFIGIQDAVEEVMVKKDMPLTDDMDTLKDMAYKRRQMHLANWKEEFMPFDPSVWEKD